MILAKSKQSSIGCCKNRKMTERANQILKKDPRPSKTAQANRLGGTGPGHAANAAQPPPHQSRPERPNVAVLSLIAPWGAASTASSDNSLEGRHWPSLAGCLTWVTVQQPKRFAKRLTISEFNVPGIDPSARDSNSRPKWAHRLSFVTRSRRASAGSDGSVEDAR